MLCGGELAGGALDYGLQVLPRNPRTNAPASGFAVELSPLDKTLGRRLVERQQALRRRVVDVDSDPGPGLGGHHAAALSHRLDASTAATVGVASLAPTAARQSVLACPRGVAPAMPPMVIRT
jgi:hypothetical protein